MACTCYRYTTCPECVKKIKDRADQLQARVEELEEGNWAFNSNREMWFEIVKLRASNTRLREALTRIAAYETGATFSLIDIDHLINMAKAALQAEEPKS
jgi:hypothetical protein